MLSETSQSSLSGENERVLDVVEFEPINDLQTIQIRSKSRVTDGDDYFPETARAHGGFFLLHDSNYVFIIY